MRPRAGHLRTNEGCWNPKIIDPLKNTATRHNSSCLFCGSFALQRQWLFILPRFKTQLWQRGLPCCHMAPGTDLGDTPCPTDKWETLTTKRPSPIHVSRNFQELCTGCCVWFSFSFWKTSRSFHKTRKSNPNPLPVRLLHCQSPCPKALKQNAIHYTLSDTSLS